MYVRLLFLVFWGVGMCLAGSSCRSTSNEESPNTTLQVSGVPADVLPVKVVKTATGFQLLRGGKPYYIKGVAGLQQLDRIKDLGGNSLRLYTANSLGAIKDKAYAQGLTVMLGLWMKPEYEDFDYFDNKAVAEQREEIRQQVLRFRNHPALLMWNVGNELDNHTQNPRAFQVLNEVVRMIHELDPHHPVTTSLTSNFNMVSAVAHFCPDLDILTVNIFGGLDKLKLKLRKDGWMGPYLVGEYGARGWWEAPQTTWKAPLDQSSDEKARYIQSRFEKSIRKEADQCLGSYVLYWGQRFEQTDMWFSLFTANGEKTAVLDMIHYLWTGKAVPNKAPRIAQFKVGGLPPDRNVFLRAGEKYEAAIQASDPEGDPLQIQWQVMPEVNENFVLPQDRTAPEALAGAIVSAQGEKAVVQAPTKKGAYRIQVLANDGHGSVATHSFPFYVGTLTAADIEKITQGSFKKKVL